jgi:hypothetical protein
MLERMPDAFRRADGELSISLRCPALDMPDSTGNRAGTTRLHAMPVYRRRIFLALLRSAQRQEPDSRASAESETLAHGDFSEVHLD